MRALQSADEFFAKKGGNIAFALNGTNYVARFFVGQDGTIRFGRIAVRGETPNGHTFEVPCKAPELTATFTSDLVRCLVDAPAEPTTPAEPF